MVQCVDCGALCGKRHPTSWMNNEYRCDRCHRKQQKAAGQVFIGILFLAFSAILTAVFSCMILRPLAASVGYGAAKGSSIGIGVGGIVLYFVMRSLANRADGCLFRMFVKLVGFLSYALGVGLLIMTFGCEDTFKGCLGVKNPAADTAIETPDKSAVSDATQSE